jgi:hypothetical protein
LRLILWTTRKLTAQPRLLEWDARTPQQNPDAI